MRDEQDAVLLPCAAVENRRHAVLQKSIARGDGTVVHVIAEIRRNESKIGRRRIEVREIGDVTAAPWRGADVSKANGGFMLSGVSSGAILAVGSHRARKTIFG